MSNVEDPSGRLTRRRFLRRAGGLVGAFVAAPAFAAPLPPQPAVVAPTELSVGILLPQSSSAPDMAASLLAGLRLAFAQARPALRVALHPADYGTSPARALEQAGALIEDGGARLLTGIVSRNGLASIAPLLADRGVPMVVSDVGANVVDRDQESPLIFRSSLNYWQSSAALGAWAAHSLGRRGAMLSSFYDSGYDTPYAFRVGFEGEGGLVAASHLSHLPSGGRGLAALLGDVAAAGPDFVFASYSGPQAVELVRAYAASGLAGRAPLIGPGMLADERLLPAMGADAQGVLTALSWGGPDSSPAARAFAASYAAAQQRRPDAFAALGYDTGLLIAAAAERAGDPRDGAAMAAALASASFAGARGGLAMDRRTHDVAAPIVLREARFDGDGPRHAVVAKLDRSPAYGAALEELRASVRTGWLNAYLCV